MRQPLRSLSVVMLASLGSLVWSASLAQVLPAGPDFPHRGYLGMSTAYERQETGGILRVRRVELDGPAARAGLREGDAVIAIDGLPLRFEDKLEYSRSLAIFQPGDRVTLSIERDGKSRDVVLEVAPPPSGYLEAVAKWEAAAEVRQKVESARAQRLAAEAELERLSARGPVELIVRRTSTGKMEYEANGALLPPGVDVASALLIEPLLERLGPGDSLVLSVRFSPNEVRIDSVKLPGHLTEKDLETAIVESSTRCRSGSGR